MNEMGRVCSTYGGEERCIQCLVEKPERKRPHWRHLEWRNLKERDHIGDTGIVGRITIKWIFRKWVVGVWTGSSWLRIGSGGGHL